MTDFLDAPRCPTCGCCTEVRREGSSQGLFCTECDWSVVTTYIPAVLCDTVSYEVRVTSGDFKNVQHLKSVAQLAGVNLLEARKLLQGQANFVVYAGQAHKVTAARDMLRVAGLAFDIRPPFPW
jgi:hypothetical protein